MAHLVNMANRTSRRLGWSEQVASRTQCSWLPEIAAYARTHPEADLGLHLPPEFSPRFVTRRVGRFLVRCSFLRVDVAKTMHAKIAIEAFSFIVQFSARLGRGRPPLDIKQKYVISVLQLLPSIAPTLEAALWSYSRLFSRAQAILPDPQMGPRTSRPLDVNEICKGCASTCPLLSHAAGGTPASPVFPSFFSRQAAPKTWCDKYFSWTKMSNES